MKVALFHNPKAGRGEFSRATLLKALAQAGHRAHYHSTKARDWKKALKNIECDVVLVAGGDGTVGKIARRLVGRAIPLSVLPLGTANNLARTLGFTGSVRKLIGAIDRARPRGFDVGLVRGPWGKRYLLEGAGGGLLAEYLAGPKEKAKTTTAKSKEAEMREHLRALRNFAEDLSAHRWSVTLDGEDFSGRYLLFVAMNICSVGPVLQLAPEARSDDGFFDFVAVKESARRKFLTYLEARIAGKKPAFPLPAVKFQRLRLKWKKCPLHLDDVLWPDKKKKKPKGSATIEIIVRPSALTVLRPR